MSITSAIVKAVLEYDDSAIRFERFCLDLYHDISGMVLVPTSTTWDMGRDGRTVTPSGLEYQGILCATLAIDIEEKIERDIKRLLETTKTKAIIYCTNKSLSEQACTRIEAKIRLINTTIESVIVLSQSQLAKLGEQHEDVIRKHYLAEITNIEDVLRQTTDTKAPASIGLRLALITQTGDDSLALRKEIIKYLILDTLIKKDGLNFGDIGVIISRALHLPKTISEENIKQNIIMLETDGCVNIDCEKVWITEKGRTETSEITQDAGRRLLEGRVAIHEAIKKLSGHSLLDDHFNRVWNIIQDGFADIFYSQGIAIINMISAIMTGETVEYGNKGRELIEKLGDKILPFFTLPSQGIEVRQALIDMFSEKESDAFKWLTQICSVYVMMCSLGFEVKSSKQVKEVLSNTYLVLDSDIVISLICEGEDNNSEISNIIKGWSALGGKLLVTIPVLEEVAHHAWISENDYNAIYDQLEKYKDDEVRHLISNAFVRSFKNLSGDNISKGYWNKYIDMFKGDTDWDYTKILKILKQEYSCEILPNADVSCLPFQNKIKDFLINRICASLECEESEVDQKMREKCKRDSIQVAAVNKFREDAKRRGLSENAIIVSSAKLLNDVDELFRREFKQSDLVVTASALGCLLTMIPGVQMGLGTLRGILFDIDISERITKIQQYAYRIIAASGEYSLPWSRRVVLQKELSDKIFADAKSKQERAEVLKKKFIYSDQPETSARIVADVLDKMAVAPENVRVIEQLRTQVKQLETRLSEKKK